MVTPTSNHKTDPGGDPRAVGDTGDASKDVDIVAAGYAEAPVYPSPTPNANLYLGSTNVSRDTINNTTCNAAVGTDIGDVTVTPVSSGTSWPTYSESRNEIHGTGKISAGMRQPGTYIVCAGANSDVLWDYITLA